MPSDFSSSLSHESGVVQCVFSSQQVSTNTCNISWGVAVSSSSVAVSSTPSLSVDSTRPDLTARLRTSPSLSLPAEGNSLKEITKTQVPVSTASKCDFSVSREPDYHLNDTQCLRNLQHCRLDASLPEGLCERLKEAEVLNTSSTVSFYHQDSGLPVISERTKSCPKTNPKKEVLLIVGDLLISKAEESQANEELNLKAEHSGTPFFLPAHSGSNLTIQKIDYKCSVLQDHSKACQCSTPRLHVYLTCGHQCRVTCITRKDSSSTIIKTQSLSTKPLDKSITPHHTLSTIMMTGKLKTKCPNKKNDSSRFSHKKLIVETSVDDVVVPGKSSDIDKNMPIEKNKQDEPESELLAEGECVWLPTIMSTLSGDVEYVVLDDDALNLGQASDRPVSPGSLKSKINTIYEDIDENLVNTSNSDVLQSMKPTKSRVSPLRRLSEIKQEIGQIVNSATASTDKKEEVSDDLATSSSLAEVCTNHCPSIKDIFGDICVKEEPLEDVKQDMTVDDFSKEILKTSNKEQSNNLPSGTFMQKEEVDSEDECEEGSGRGLFAKLIKEESNANEEVNIIAPNSDDSLGPLQIDEKYFPSSEDTSLSLVKDVMELSVPSVNIISPFKIKILLGSPKNESHQVHAEPTPQVGPSSNNMFGKVVEVKKGVLTPEKVKRTAKKSQDSTSMPVQLTSSPGALKTVDSIQSLTCIYCHTSCPDIQALAEHFENHQKDGLIICYFCQKSFGDKTGMKRHMRTHTGEKPYQCKICGKRFSLPGNFKKHRDIHEDKRTEPCGVCGKTFRRKEHLKYHMRTHTGEKPFRCSECGSCFTARYSLQIHMNIHLGKRPYKCTYCSKAFSDKSTMRKHVRVHTGEKPFRCQECWRCFGESGTLAAHMATHRNERPFRCDKCELCFKTTGGLRQHEKVHSGEKQFACRFCGMKFLQKYNMTMHERIHTGEKPYTCSHCQRSFRSRSCLAKHVVLHGGDDERRFGCDHCNSRFYRKAHLRRHIDMHLGIKNYKCDYCQKKFSTRGTLRSHLKTFHSHGARRFPCNRCGRVFKRQVYVNTHLCANTAFKSESRNENGEANEDAHTAVFNNESTDSEDVTFEVKSEPEESVVEDIEVNNELDEDQMDYTVLEKEVELEWEPQS
ncbi:uncharacterized protein LOC126997306 isoform X1 [Eriocheir sinensis]|uniref:uncharacterized protein LOC126997306 isoform X1 n=2 Tax=Eriocheir sinensis TaxID=95602 RepID=UPI0021C6F326|nr:uncharacterized protein LOC126997306 isoform X1 [Eriocheir sinensis]